MYDPNVTYSRVPQLDGRTAQYLAQQGYAEGHSGGYVEPPADNSPVKEGDDLHVLRRTTDRTWLWMFMLMLIWFTSTFVASVFVGSPGGLHHPRNYQGLACGWDSSVRALPNLFYPLDPVSGRAMELYAQRGMCVAQCPGEKDVAAKGFVTIPENALLQDKRQEAWLSVLHQIRSPVYATKQTAGHLCLPQHPILAQQFRQIINSSSFGVARLLAAGLSQALPLLLGLGIAMICLSWTALKVAAPIPGTVCGVMQAFSVICSFTLGLRFIFRAARAPLDSVALPDDQRGLIVLGTLLLLACGILTVYTWRNWTFYSDASLLWYTRWECQRRIGSTMRIHYGLQMLQAFVCFLGLVTLIFVGSRTTTFGSPTVASIDPNGGVEISTLDKYEFTSIGTSLKFLGVMFCTLWLAETVLTLSKFVASYSAVVRFIRPLAAGLTPCHNPSAGLNLAVDYSLGTLAILSLLRFISRPVRMWNQTRTSYHYYTRSLNPQSETQTARETVTYKLTELIQNPILCEIIVKGGDLKASVKEAITRVYNAPHDATAAALGLPGLITWAHGVCVWLATFAMACAFFHSLQDSGACFASFAELSAAYIATIMVYVTSISWSAYEAEVDAIVYEALYEMETQLLVAPNQVPTLQVLCPPELHECLDKLAWRQESVACESGGTSEVAEPQHLHQHPEQMRQYASLQSQHYASMQAQ